MKIISLESVLEFLYYCKYETKFVLIFHPTAIIKDSFIM